MKQGTRETLFCAIAVVAMFAACDPGIHNIGAFPDSGMGGGGEISGATGGGSGGGSNTGGGINTGGGVGTGGGTAVIDAGHAPCDCEVSGFTMTVSWACYREHFFYDRQPNQTCGGYIESSRACGLTVIELYGPRGTIVRDGSGAAVGGMSQSDLSDYVCPDDASLHAINVRGGLFPDAGCSVTACTCADGGIECP